MHYSRRSQTQRLLAHSLARSLSKPSDVLKTHIHYPALFESSTKSVIRRGHTHTAGYNKKVSVCANTHTQAHIQAFGIVTSWVTSSLVVSALIKSNVTKRSARLNVNLGVIGQDRLNICLKQFNRRPEVTPATSRGNNCLSFGSNFGWTCQICQE